VKVASAANACLDFFSLAIIFFYSYKNFFAIKFFVVFLVFCLFLGLCF